jgi:membrane-bound serine protease (ClpP class)
MKQTGLILLLTIAFSGLNAQKMNVMVMDIKSEIGPRMNRYVELALKHAEDTKADVVIIEMDTYGGTLTDAKEIGDKIMKFKKPIWIFINPNAASAGALISITCDKIYMAPRANIGAATVVDGSGNKAIDKYQAVMRTYMRTAAEESHRDPRIAEGMVDEEIVIDGVKKAGKIIMFTTPEAIKHGYCEGKAETLEDILKQNSITDPNLAHFELSTIDSIIDFFLNPLISGILILIIIGGIYFELQAPGIGLPIFAAIIALVFYLVPYYLNGLAQNWEILAFIIGVFLIALEIFVIPGFGVTGIAGIILTVGALVLIMVNNDAFDFEFVKMNDVLIATVATIGGLLGGIGLLVFGGATLSNTKSFQRMTLTNTQERAKGYTANFNKEPMTGKKGVAHTVLRPSGRVLIDGQLYDAFTKAGYVEKGTAIEVIDEEGSTLRVRVITEI